MTPNEVETAWSKKMVMGVEGYRAPSCTNAINSRTFRTFFQIEGSLPISALIFDPKIKAENSIFILT